jgi:hypothetical protein
MSPKRKPAGRADFARQVAKVKQTATDADLRAEVEQLAEDAGADPRVRAWLLRLFGCDGGKGANEREK